MRVSLKQKRKLVAAFAVAGTIFSTATPIIASASTAPTNPGMSATSNTSSAPVLDEIHANDTAITGTGTPGSTIYITGNGESISGTVEASGHFSIKIKKAPQDAAYQAIAKNTNGKISEVAKGIVMASEKTVTPSVVPTINPVNQDDTMITGTGTAGETIYVSGSGKSYSGVVDTSGHYSITIEKAAKYAIYQAVAKNEEGKFSEAASTTVIASTKVVTTPIAAPTINQVTENDTTITGTGTAGGTVYITSTNQSYSGSVDVSGHYSVKISKAAKGTVYQVIVKTPEGKISEVAKNTTAAAKITAAPATTPTVNQVNENDTMISGSGAAGNTINITLSGHTYTAPVDASGHFSVNISKAQKNTFYQVIAKSADGKFSAAISVPVVASKVTETSSTVAAPTINQLIANDTVLTGTAVSNSTVYVTGDGQTFVGKTDRSGHYTIHIARAQKGSSYQALVKTDTGKVSEVATSIVK